MVFAFSLASITFTEQPKDVASAPGTTAKFRCNASTTFLNQDLIYFWKFNGSFISQHNTNGLLLKNETLLVTNFTSAKHSGKYQCVVSSLGSGSMISKSATLESACKFSNFSTRWTWSLFRITHIFWPDFWFCFSGRYFFSNSARFWINRRNMLSFLMLLPILMGCLILLKLCFVCCIYKTSVGKVF